MSEEKHDVLPEENNGFNKPGLPEVFEKDIADLSGKSGNEQGVESDLNTSQSTNIGEQNKSSTKPDFASFAGSDNNVDCDLFGKTGDFIADSSAENENATSELSKTTEVRSESVTSKHKDEFEDIPSYYNIKWIKYQNNTLPIITQNDNGPCPLLAIMNYLLLQQKISLAPSTELITSTNLISSLADYIFDNVPKNINAETRLNYEQKMNDAIAMFPKLQTGLDVNVRFTGVADFEYTSSSEVFDLLDIPLFHGWLVDPDAVEVKDAVGNATYNQLVEKIINLKSSANSKEAAQAFVAEEFLSNSASQITYHGLNLLSSTLNDSQMGVLFRNNHFHTLLKHNGELYVLATDQGFLQEPGVVWETLSNIEGDSHFVDANFRLFHQSAPKPSVQTTSSTFSTATDQIDQDYLVALSLQREQGESNNQFSSWAALGLSDHELALRLQEEENKLAETPAASSATAERQPPPTTATQQRARVSATSASSVSKDKKSLCSVM